MREPEKNSKVAALLIGDGRDEYHEAAYQSLKVNIGIEQFDQVIKVDDSEHRLGFAGAIQHGWQQVASDFVFHMELDFTFNWPVDIGPIIKTLEQRKYLTQIALLRQPVNESERSCGGIIQQSPSEYQQVELPDGRGWIEHSKFFTTNPSIYPAWVVERGWPQRPQSEGVFGVDLFGEDPARRSAFWGHGEQWVRHIGDERAGTGY